MENLNTLELSILNRLSKEYPNIKNHIPYLRVLTRECTGVGMYVNFCYVDTTDCFSHLTLSNSSISTNEVIEVPNLKYGLGYEVNITEGKLNFIEFVTYGEDWDGNIENAYLPKDNIP